MEHDSVWEKKVWDGLFQIICYLQISGCYLQILPKALCILAQRINSFHNQI